MQGRTQHLFFLRKSVPSIKSWAKFLATRAFTIITWVPIISVNSVPPNTSSLLLLAVFSPIVIRSEVIFSSKIVAIRSLISVIDAPVSASTWRYLPSIIIVIITAPRWSLADPSDIAAVVRSRNSSCSSVIVSRFLFVFIFMRVSFWMNVDIIFINSLDVSWCLVVDPSIDCYSSWLAVPLWPFSLWPLLVSEWGWNLTLPVVWLLLDFRTSWLPIYNLKKK